MSSEKLSHLDENGNAHMVDVGDKAVTSREAVAGATVEMGEATMRALLDKTTPKGDVLAVARIAGIQAAKRTSDLIPLCHAIGLSSCKVEFTTELPGTLRIETRVRAADRTGVEMEALTAAAVAGLTIYDMLKAIDREMVIGNVAVLEKRGGRRGEYVRNAT